MRGYSNTSRTGLTSLSSTAVESNGFDDIVHTPSSPYCDDPSYWCHDDANYHNLAIQPVALDVDNAFLSDFFGLEVL